MLLVEEPADLSQVADKLYQIMLYRVHLTLGQLQMKDHSRNKNEMMNNNSP